MTNGDSVSKHAVWKTTVAITDWHYAKFMMYVHLLQNMKTDIQNRSVANLELERPMTR
jgi:hypothetical protein